MCSSLRHRFPNVLIQLLPNHNGSPGKTGRCRHQIESDRSNPRNEERKQFLELFLEWVQTAFRLQRCSSCRCFISCGVCAWMARVMLIPG